MKKIIHILLAVICLMSFAITGLSQGWERSYGTAEADSYRSILLASNGDLICGGTSVDATSMMNGMWLTRLDPTGEVIWQRHWQDTTQALQGRKLLTLPNGHHLLLGIVLPDNSSAAISAWIFDDAGNSQTQWIHPELAFDLKDALVLPDGQVALVGSILQTDSSGLESQDAIITILDPVTGVIDWTRSYNGGNTDVANGLVLINDQTLALAGYSIKPNFGDFNILLLQYDLNGNLLTEKNYGTIFPELVTDIQIHNNELLLIGQTETFATDGDDLFVMNCSLAGDSLELTTYSYPGQDFPRAFKITNEDEFFIVGDTRLESNQDRNLVVWKMDAASNLLWTKTFGGFDDDLAYDVNLNVSGQAIIAGYTQSFGNGLSDGYVLTLDSLGQTYPVAVIGNVSWDKDLDCSMSAADEALENWIVIAGSDSLSRATTSDELGNYELFLPPGTYDVILSPPNTYWASCADTVSVNVVAGAQPTVVNYAVQPEIECPLLYVDLSTPFLRRCFQNRYTIAVENRGTLVADPASVTLTVDEFLNVDSFSIAPSSQTGNVYEFTFGQLNPWEPVVFSMWATVDCETTVLGQTHCITAEAFPDSLCLPLSPMWDQSSLTVEATCDHDSITFVIRNDGIGATGQHQGIVIIEDDILLSVDSVTLQPGADTTIVINNPGGSTYRLEVEQSAGHPGNSHPSATVEGCGGSPSTGYVIILPQDDGNPFVDIDCRENQGSYDPNDKQGFPLGYSDRHFITIDTDLEYLLRFQNTGTDTAFTVKLRDTLSALLNLNTLRVGSASHEMSWSIADRELSFQFDNINLPDSTTDLSGSQGWVEFKIKPHSDLDTGSVIYNQAGIYFDFNDPVITAATFHEIGENFVIIDLIDHTVESPLAANSSLRVFPNPFQNYTDFKMSAIAAGQTELLIYGLDGRLLKRCPVVDQAVKLKPDHWPSGIYIYRWQSENELLETGKIILQR